jgi:hypothetical protein
MGLKTETVSSQPLRALIFDLETAPNLSWVWGHYEQNVIEHEVEKYILSVSYKWLGEDKVYVKSLPDYKGYNPAKECDKKLCEDLWKLFDEADIVIAHNGDAFDIKTANTRFIYNGISPYSDFRTIDTLKIARKHFKFNSNKLNDLGQFLGVGQKRKHDGFSTWKGCMSGDQKAWKTMCEYNKQDVALLERVYLALRPWAKGHPDVSTLTGAKGCPYCGSPRAHKRGFSYTNLMRAQRYQCQAKGCHGYYQGSRMKIPLEAV